MPQITHPGPRAWKRYANREDQPGRISRQLCIASAVAMVFLPGTCAGQKRPYTGLLGGVSTLSADGSTTVEPEAAAASSYKPENGPTLDVFAGMHWNNFLSFQADYLWNRNPLTLNALRTNANLGAPFYGQEYRSGQHTVLGSALLYFRSRPSWVRPFLSVGTGVAHLTADPRSPGIARGMAPPATFRSTMAVLHVAVGIDLRVHQGWALRYSFAETSSANPVSRQLAPPGTRMLANFRNLFGIVKEF
jgi:hypothetical protein